MTVKECLECESVCKLNLSSQDRDLVCDQISGLEWSFKNLDKIDAGNAEPLVSIIPQRNIIREDTAVEFCPREVILSGAIEQSDGYFRIPKTPASS